MVKINYSYVYRYCLWLVAATALFFASGCSSERKARSTGNKGSAWVKQYPLDSTATDSVTLVPGAGYKAGELKQWLAGEHYRETWLTPVTVPVLHIEKEKGGLTPVKAGGNMQTTSLQMRSNDGRKYVIRSVQKNPVKTIPEGLRKTFVVDLARDQVSTMHPYGALAAAKLAEAAGVYHTNPRLVYVPYSEALGQFRVSHGGMLALFEEKPSGDWGNTKSFGYSHNIVTTEEVIEKTLTSFNNRVDERAFCRARLLDILISDWDRSEDQWAWASFTHDSITVYKPIPRDRDQAFVKMDGFFPWILSRKFAARKYQGFAENIHDMKGLNYNARWIDRSFLTGLSRSDWKSIADSIKMALTDEVITDAIKRLPAAQVYAEDLIRKLKARRDALTSYAEMYYNVLADEVAVTGSSGSDLFEVQRLDNDSTRVRVYRCRVTEKMTGEEGDPNRKKQLKAEKQELVYERIFITGETDEIQLFGFDGSDVFDVSGEVKKGIMIRIVGGEGYDRINDMSHVDGVRKRTKVYDIRDRNDLVLGEESRDLTSYDVRVNDFDRQDFNYDETGPRALVEYNFDDGIYIGGGVLYRHYSFRKKPYSQQHELVAAASIKTGASYIRYGGDFISLLRKWDLKVDAEATPLYATTFFGLGNESRPPDVADDSYNLFRMNQVLVSPGLKREADHHLFKIGPEYRYVQVRREEGTFITSPEAGLTADDFRPKHYGGLEMLYRYYSVDNDLVPRQGLKMKSALQLSTELNSHPQAFSRASGEVSGYIPLPVPVWATLALRIGGAVNFDKFEFWQANYVGGIGIYPGNLRGYRRNRFGGRTSLYQDTELRIKVFNFDEFGQAGVFGFVDHGRVWLDNESSERLHRGYGGGMWITPFNKVVITATYGISAEEKLFNLSTGFCF